MILLRVSYTIKAHHLNRFDEVFAEKIRPLISKHGLRFQGIWRTLVGNAGEYLELWEFESLTEFEQKWKALMEDPELQRIFETTGPWVENETFSLMEPVMI